MKETIQKQLSSIVVLNSCLKYLGNFKGNIGGRGFHLYKQKQKHLN